MYQAMVSPVAALCMGDNLLWTRQRKGCIASDALRAQPVASPSLGKHCQAGHDCQSLRTDTKRAIRAAAAQAEVLKARGG